CDGRCQSSAATADDDCIEVFHCSVLSRDSENHDSQSLPFPGIVLRMTQELDVDSTIRQRIRALRQSRGWSLESLASKAQLSVSTLSRIETGSRRIALDQLVPIARALGTTLDELVATAGRDVVIRPEPVDL